MFIESNKIQLQFIVLTLQKYNRCTNIIDDMLTLIEVRLHYLSHAQSYKRQETHGQKTYTHTHTNKGSDF